MTPARPRPRTDRLDLDFRRALQRVPVRHRPSLRTSLRRYRRHCRHDAHAARPFHELDPATGQWRDYEHIHAHPIPHRHLLRRIRRNGSVEA